VGRKTRGFRPFRWFLYISLLQICIGKNTENYLNYLNPPYDQLGKRRETKGVEVYRMEVGAEAYVGDNREGAKSKRDGSLQIEMRM